jgi:hypothetical protein
MIEGNSKPHRPHFFFFDTSVSMRKYIFCMGLISLVPSIIIALLLAVIGIADEGSGPDFKGPTLVVLALVLVVGPAIETLLTRIFHRFWSFSIDKWPNCL